MIHKGPRNKYPDHFEITHKIKQKRNKLVSPPQSKNKMISEDTFDLSMYQKKSIADRSLNSRTVWLSATLMLDWEFSLS